MHHHSQNQYLTAGQNVQIKIRLFLYLLGKRHFQFKCMQNETMKLVNMLKEQFLYEIQSFS